MCKVSISERREIMKKFMLLTTSFALIFVTSLPQVAGMLGVSTYAAKRIVDAVMAGASVWTIISLMAISGGSAALAWTAVRAFIKRFGAATATAW